MKIIISTQIIALLLLLFSYELLTYKKKSITSIEEHVYSGDLLRETAQQVDPLDEGVKELVNLLVSKANTGENAVGLAAPQLGINKAAFVYRVPTIVDGQVSLPEFWQVALNAQYTPIGKDIMPMAEGCFSVPHLYSIAVPRFNKVHFTYQDLDGGWIEKVVSGDEAHIVQHETDHLNGILYIDKLSDKGDLFTRQELYKKMKDFPESSNQNIIQDE